MARRLSTVSDLVSEIREQIDEFNTDSVDTEARILPALNRGLEYAWDLLARRYPDQITRSATITANASLTEYDLPEDCFEDRVLRVEVNINGSYQEVRRIAPYDAWQFESSSPTSTPSRYSIQERTIRFYPASNGTYNFRVWYIRECEQLVLPQGRITSINTASNYVIVDAAGTDLTTESDSLSSYVNIVDSQTGLIKASLQIQTSIADKLTFRTTPTRTSVLNRTIGDEIPSTVQLDDQVCLVRGTCIPPQSPMRNFLVQFTSAEIIRSLGGDAATEEQVLQKYEKQVENTSAGREGTKRVQRRSSAWGQTFRRFFLTTKQ